METRTGRFARRNNPLPPGPIGSWHDRSAGDARYAGRTPTWDRRARLRSAEHSAPGISQRAPGTRPDRPRVLTLRNRPRALPNRRIDLTQGAVEKYPPRERSRPEPSAEK